jgi:MFS family permease
MHISLVRKQGGEAAGLPRLLLVEGATWLAAYATPVVLAFAVLDSGGSSGDVGVVLAADTLGMLVSAPYGGAIADRLPRNLVMCAAEVSAALFQGGAVLVLASGFRPLPWLALLQAAVGVSRGFFFPASTGLVASLIPDDGLRQRANGWLGTAQAASRLAAPPAAGLVVAAASAETALCLNIGAYTTSAILLLSLRTGAPAGPREKILAVIGRGWRELRRREWLWLTVAWFSALQCVAQAPLLVLGPGIAKQALGGSTGWGIVMGALGSGAAAGAVLAATLHIARPLRPAIAAYALYALPLLALAKPLPLPMVAAAAALAGAAGGFFAACWFTMFQKNVPHDAISSVSAWDWEASLAGLPLGMLLAPQLARTIGAPLTLLGASGLTVAMTLLVAPRASIGRPSAFDAKTEPNGGSSPAASQSPTSAADAERTSS